MKAEIFSWGGAEEVTGSKHFLRVDDQLFMVDCGAFQGRRMEAEKKNRSWSFDAAGVDALILTHAHYDHSGLIPMLKSKGFTGNIYTTPASRDLANLIMMDSAHIQSKDLEYLRKKAGKKGETLEKQPLYTERDVINCLEHFVSISYHRPFFIGDGMRVEFYDAGHILGSAVTLFEVKKNGQNLRLAFSGDLGRKNLPILRDPERIPPVDYLIMESTYGNRLHDPIDSATEKLAHIVRQTAEKNGKIIIPAFAVERTQEIVYILHLLSDQGRIPKIPVYVDSPMATNATSIFRVHQECYDQEIRQAFIDHHKNPFGWGELTYVIATEDSKRLNGLRGPAVIISASGMCESGRILHHLKNSIEDPKNTILIVGFMAQNTLGRRIIEREPEVKIFGDLYRVRARVEVLNTFSAHADYNDILEYISGLDGKRLKGIFLVHGEPEAQSNLKRLLEEKGYGIKIIRYGETYQLNEDV
ncbi:MAG: MBL fold metallo-hydrolase [Spirochaetes bacterium DG_61]|jgi:metallo-beta-lactamase family protein|nr:MAG: MBL fold metallo-hydrolase [Spirochaetes bacterium DG_61]